MSTTVQAIIEAAYSRSTANAPGKLAVDDELIGRLHRRFQALFALYGRARPDDASSEVTLTLGGSPAAVTLPDDVIEVRYLRNVAGAQVHLIPERERSRRWHLAPSVFRRGMSLVTRGAAGDPVATDAIRCTIVDAPTALSALSSTIDSRFPVRHHELLVDDLALYLDAKDVGRDALAHEKLAKGHQENLAGFAAEYGLNVSALEDAHSDAEREGKA